MKILSFDIETSGLYADSSYILTWSIFDHEKNQVFQCEHYKLMNDYSVIKHLFDFLKKINKNKEKTLIISFNGIRFDIPYIIARAYANNIEIPILQNIYHKDLYLTIKNKFRIYRKNLENLTHFLNIEGKNHVDMKIWKMAEFGDKNSLFFVLDHNYRDTKILSKFYLKTKNIYDFSKLKHLFPINGDKNDNF